MSDYVIINDATNVVVASVNEDQLTTMFPFLSKGDVLEYWENLIKTTTKWAGNSLYKKV